MTAIRLVEGLRYETVGDETLVLHVGRNTVLRLTGPSRELVERLRAGETVDVWDEVAEALAEAGLVEPRGDVPAND